LGSGVANRELRMPSASMASSSPGSTSRTNDPPTMSSAAVSLAITQPRSSRPRTRGRTPCGSRAAYRVASSANTSEYAPRSRGRSRIAASSTPMSAAVAASSSVTRSESVLAPMPLRWPSLATSSRSSAVLTRLPLWPSAMPLPAAVVRNVGWAFSQVVDPVVE
jgi:hypothetical protein